MSEEAQTSEGVTISRCGACGAGFYPVRWLCPKCGANAMKPDKVAEAVVEEATVVRHNAGQQNWQPRHLATARTAENQMIVVGLDGPATRGARLSLYERGLAPFGRSV